MKMSKIMLLWAIMIGIFCFWTILNSYTDTVVLKNNQRLKGVVVEDYKDRVVLSTMEGEKQIMRNSVRSVIFDLEEQNLASLADFYQDQGAYEKAYYYYDKALKINPRYKKARDGLNYVGTYLRQTGRMQKLDHIKRLEEERRWKQRQRRAPAPEVQNREEEIKRSLGIVLENAEESFEIADVVLASPAAKAGIKKGDILLAAWGRAVGYMQPEEVMKKLADPGVMDIQVTIARSFRLKLKDRPGNYNSLIGTQLGFSEMEGLMVEKVNRDGVADRAGIEEGDIVTEIQGQSTRYMSLKDVERIISSRKGDSLSLKIKRDMAIWKKFETK